MSTERKPILIRGLDHNLYQRILAKAKELGKTVGELMNEVMKGYLEGLTNNPDPDPNTLEIAGSVSLSRDDIVNIWNEIGEFSIKNSGELIIGKDVDKEALQRIKNIENTGLLKVPSHLHYLILLKSRKIYGKIEKY